MKRDREKATFLLLRDPEYIIVIEGNKMHCYRVVVCVNDSLIYISM